MNAWQTSLRQWVRLPECECLQMCMFESLCVSVLHDWACTLVCLLPESIFAGARHDDTGCSDTHLVACCLKNTGLKISPRALALSRFLELFWHTLAKCLRRHWSVSQYWGGKLGVLAMQRSSWVHSAGFTTSVETDENGREVSEADVKKWSCVKA